MPYYTLRVKIDHRFVCCTTSSDAADLQEHAAMTYPGKMFQISPATTAEEAKLARLQLSQQAA
jgi:hypothetical protein